MGIEAGFMVAAAQNDAPHGILTTIGQQHKKSRCHQRCLVEKAARGE